MSSAKLPALWFYPADWLKDTAVRSVSVSARGMWIDMLCFMSESERRGYLVLNGRPIADATVARMCGVDATEGLRCIQELETAAVFSRTKDGAIYNRRMVRDTELRDLRAKSGSLGGLAKSKQTSSKSLNTETEVSLNVQEEIELKQKAEKLYALYPRKVGRGQALKAIRGALKKATYEAILDGLQRYVKEREGKEPEYTKHPATWFNGECWADAPDAAPLTAAEIDALRKAGEL